MPGWIGVKNHYIGLMDPSLNPDTPRNTGMDSYPPSLDSSHFQYLLSCQFFLSTIVSSSNALILSITKGSKPKDK